MISSTFARRLALPALLYALSPLSQAANLYQEALNYQRQGEPTSAIIQLKNLLSEQPDNAEARLLLGTLYLQTGQFLGAEKELNRAQELASQDPQLALLLVRSQLGQGLYKEALKQLQTLTFSDPANATERWLLLGHSHRALGQLDQAQTAYLQAEALAPSAEISLGLARLALQQQHPEIALKRAAAVLDSADSSSGSKEALLIRGQVYLQQRQGQSAQQAFDELLQQQAGHPQALLGRVKALMLLGKAPEARISLDQLLSIASRAPEALLLSAVLHLQAGNSQLAKEILDPLSQQFPQQAELLHLAGYANLLLGHMEQAEQQLSSNLANHPEYAPSRLALAQLQLKQNQLNQAQSTLAPLLEKSPVAAEVLALAGTLSLRQGDAVAASQYFQQALAQGEHSELARPLALAELLSGDTAAGIARLEGLGAEDRNLQSDTLLLRAYLRLKQPDRARKLLGERIQSDADTPVYRLMAAALELQLQQPEVAKQHLQRVLSQDPGSVPALLGMALLATQEKAPREVEAWYRKAHEADLDDIRPVQGQINLALTEQRVKTALQQASEFYRSHSARQDAAQLYLSVLQRLGRTEQLQEQLAEIIQAQPDVPAFRLQQAVLNLAGGNIDAGTLQLDSLLLLQPDYMPARLARIKLLLAQQQPQKSLEANLALPSNIQAHPAVTLLRGDAYQLLKQPQAALEEYLQAYQLQPTSETALRLGRSYAATQRSDKAIGFLEQHLQQQAKDSAVRSLLAGLLQQAGNNLEAIKVYEQLTQEHPEDLVAWNNLAWLYQHQQDPRAAAAAEQAYTLAPDNAAVIDTLGWILLASDPQRALQLLAVAAKELPEDGAVQYHYAAALAKNSRTYEAKLLLQDLEKSTFAEKKEAMALLQALNG